MTKVDTNTLVHIAWELTKQVEQDARRIALMLNAVEYVGDVLESREGQYGFHVTEQEFAEISMEYVNETRANMERLEKLLREITPYTEKYILEEAAQVEKDKQMYAQWAVRNGYADNTTTIE